MSPAVLVLMGVSGSGKSTVGRALADRLGWAFEEGDLLHPPENVAKMASGIPLTDADRAPWLDRVAGWIEECLRGGRAGIISCSALRRRYRDRLRRPEVTFVLLDVARDELRERLAQRAGHFMPSSLLDSQLSALERPAADERAIIVAAGLGVPDTVDAIVAHLS